MIKLNTIKLITTLLILCFPVSSAFTETLSEECSRKADLQEVCTEMTQLHKCSQDLAATCCRCAPIWSTSFTSCTFTQAIFPTPTPTPTPASSPVDPSATPTPHPTFVNDNCPNQNDYNGDGFDDLNGLLYISLGSAVCNDGIDEDGDGHSDYLSDPGCSTPKDKTETSTENVCDNGIDDDKDGTIDWRGVGRCLLIAEIEGKDQSRCSEAVFASELQILTLPIKRGAALAKKKLKSTNTSTVELTRIEKRAALSLTKRQESVTTCRTQKNCTNAGLLGAWSGSERSIRALRNKVRSIIGSKKGFQGITKKAVTRAFAEMQTKLATLRAIQVRCSEGQEGWN